MGYELAPGERVILLTRPQPGSLAWPAVLFILIPAGCTFAAGWLTRNQGTFDAGVRAWMPAAMMAITGVGLVLLLLYCLRPLLGWLGTRYVLTSRRLISRRGLLRRNELQSPLVAVQQLGMQQSLRQRALRSGNISIDLGNGRRTTYVDVPEVARFRNIVLQTIEDLPQTAMFNGLDFRHEIDQSQDSWDGTLREPGQDGDTWTDGTGR
ncbi:PH domain-containing protein [Arthrobacter sp. H14]|uniref:PH domain-containing protein n=1 Tax=Arthrobacter sp. H14 TaxID=1312959 RepID=UPI00047B13A7|nr:PH domain-containing protein [Arthrobacter sp. H14]